MSDTETKPQGTGFGVKVVAVLAAAGVLWVVGVGMGWWGVDESEEEGRRVQVEFEVIWGRQIDTGEFIAGTDLPKFRIECTDADISIKYWVDGQEYTGDPTESDAEVPCRWVWEIEVPFGSDLRLRATYQGWKMCAIFADGKIVVPNGFSRSLRGDPCEAWGVAIS